MRKLILASLLILTSLSYAQEKSNWTKKGNINLLFNQSAFNNEWLGGGTSNIAGNVNFAYEFNYSKNDWSWDNRLSAAYGLTKIKGDDITKSDDRLEFNSIVGKKASGHWFYSGIVNFKTQFDRGENKDGAYISHFMSPAYLQTGLGMLYKPSATFKLNIAPVTGKLIMVDGQFTETESAFGVAQGETSRKELGASVNVYSKYEVVKNVSFENILNLYSNYLEDAQNIDIDYTLNIVMKINKYMSTNISFQTIYDDNAISAAQVKEVFGLGINYGF
ncbi:DUF3078 domain-containing protein [Flavicella sediminum]|uniref:DUF3078 domain-containing protein n=1 Tax=Flavicella sediminum TaxID=2585141 RepID=UPI00112301BF|nr:DUF3078 domain-containing protein [Flavicella sediminum]